MSNDGLTLNQLAERNALLVTEVEKLRAEREQLAAENVALKATSDDRRMFIMNAVQLGYIKVPTVETDPALETIRIAVSPQEPTHATDRIVAGIKADGVEEFAAMTEKVGDEEEFYDHGESSETLKYTAKQARLFAQQLREGASE